MGKRGDQGGVVMLCEIRDGLAENTVVEIALLLLFFLLIQAYTELVSLSYRYRTVIVPLSFETSY